MTTRNESTLRGAVERPLRMAAALATLPAASEAMRDELGRWMEMVTPTEGGAATSDVKYGASTDAAMATTTWRISAGVDRIRPGLDRYFADFGADDSAAGFLDASLEMFKAQRVGIWIEMGDDALDTGWYFDEPLDVTKVFAVAGGGGSLGEKALAWANRNRVSRTAYVARSLGAKTPYHDIFLEGPSIDAAMELIKSFDLAPPDARLEDGLRRAATTTGVSVRLTESKLTRVGILARAPSTQAVLTLVSTRDKRDPRLLAAFEGALGVKGAAWAEHEIYAGRTNLELHYTLE